MELSVIVVSHNTRELLAGCLRSVLASLASGPSYEVIVVDNASRDGTVKMLEERYPQVRLLKNERNKGFAAATNQGLRESQGEYLLLLNSDTIVRRDALPQMVRFLAESPQAGVVGPKLLYPDGKFQHSAFTFPTLPMIFLDFFPLNHRFLNSRLNGRYPKALYEKGEPFPVGHPLGAAMMTKRQVVEEVGLLDEEFFMYCEEIDWCIRVKKAGWEIFCLPRVEIVHYGAASTSRFREAMFVELHKSRYCLYRKHYGPLFRGLARFIVGLGVRREMIKARRTVSQGLITKQELEERLGAYRRVLELP